MKKIISLFITTLISILSPCGANTYPAEIFNQDDKVLHEYIDADDFETFFKAISKQELSLSRGEFETKKEYLERLKTIPLYRNDLAFILIPTHSNSFTYNIDTESFFFTEWSVLNKESSLTIIANHKFDVLNNNSLSHNRTEIFGINILDIKQRNIFDNKYIVSFNLSPNIAKELKNNMEIIAECLIVKRNGKYTTSNATNWLDPDSKNKEMCSEHFINIKILKFHIIDKRTNKLITTIEM